MAREASIKTVGAFPFWENMKYIVMCGGTYSFWQSSRWETVIKGEKLVERTIRLLRENGIEDIAISSNDKKFEKYGVPVLVHNNPFRTDDLESTVWWSGFYPMDEPVCYLFGDVYFSDRAIQTIVNYQTDDIMLFASVKPFDDRYIKNWAEPFGFKVVDTDHFHRCLEQLSEYHRRNMFNRHPCSWELWQIIKHTPLNEIRRNYCGISDYTCDIDSPEDAVRLEERL